jgi:protein-tyrosine phosphatase
VFRNLFSRPNLSKYSTDFSSVMTDMHSHLIPGIDDGARTIEDSLQLVKLMHALGYTKLITTPHIQAEFYKNTPEIIKSGLQLLRKAIDAENIPVRVDAAAEYLVDDGFEEKMNSGSLLSFSDKYVLIEISYYSPHPNLKSLIFNLQCDGYKVILAHPERYSYWYNDFGKFNDLKDRGVFFQVNAVSLAGFYPDPVKKFAEKLIDHGMIEFIGSDMHNSRYMDALQKCQFEKSLAKLVASGKLMNSKL